MLWLLSNSNLIYGALVASVWSSDTINSPNLESVLSESVVGRLAPAAILYIHEKTFATCS